MYEPSANCWPGQHMMRILRSGNWSHRAAHRLTCSFREVLSRSPKASQPQAGSTAKDRASCHFASSIEGSFFHESNSSPSPRSSIHRGLLRLSANLIMWRVEINAAGRYGVKPYVSSVIGCRPHTVRTWAISLLLQISDRSVSRLEGGGGERLLSSRVGCV